MLLQLGRDRHALAAKQRRDPFRGPGALAGIVDARERLQGHRLGSLVRERAAEVMPVAAHRQGRRPDRPAEVEGEDLGARISAELEGHQRQQDGLPRAGRADDQSVADIADMEREAERRRAFRPREEQRGAAKMLIPFRPRPDGRERHHVREIQRRDRRLANVGVDVARQRAEPRLEGVDRLAHAGEVAALDGLFDQPKPLVGGASVFVPDRDRRGDVGFADEIGAQLLKRGVGVDRLVGSIRSPSAPTLRWS